MVSIAMFTELRGGPRIDTQKKPRKACVGNHVLGSMSWKSNRVLKIKTCVGNRVLEINFEKRGCKRVKK